MQARTTHPRTSAGRRASHVLTLLCLVACGGESKPAEPASAAPVAAPVAPAEPTKPAGPVVEENIFRIAFEEAKPYTAGQPGELKVVIEPRGGYHINQDYPTRIDLKAPAAVKLAKPSLGKGDAAAFGEQNARFDVGFTADKGSHDLSATVDFAVCTAETCVPEQRTIAIALNVQ
jgi:hypothetical protein